VCMGKRESSVGRRGRGDEIERKCACARAFMHTQARFRPASPSFRRCVLFSMQVWPRITGILSAATLSGTDCMDGVCD
jgi:hypothetical protein